MTIDKIIQDTELKQRNINTARDMQLWYLDNYKPLSDIGYDADKSVTYYLSCIHPCLKQYQLHLNFYREDTEK